jgi:TRAP transporter TAXI family solute receptor
VRFLTKHTSLFLALPLMFALVFAACAPAETPAPTSAPAPTAAPAAAPTKAAAPEATAAASAPTKAEAPAASKTELPPLTVDKSKWPQAVSIGSASVGGTNYIAAGGLAKVFEKIGVPAAPEATGGSVQNPQLIQSGQIQFANIAQGSAFEAWNGTGWANGKKHDKLRSLFAILPQLMHGWALKKSGINTFADLEGKIVSGGPAGGTSDAYLRQFTEFLGIKPAKIVTTGFADTTGQLRDGLLDAVAASSGVPNPSCSEIASTQDVTILGFDEATVKKLVEQFPSQVPGEVPAGTYNGQDEAILTLADWLIFFTDKDMPEDLVYEYVKAVFESKEMLLDVHKAMENVTEDNVKNVALPMHPGAYRYYMEKGIEVNPLAKPID